MIGESALAHQLKIESGEQTVVGVNAYQIDEDPQEYRSQPYPEPTAIDAQIARLKTFKKTRSNADTTKALDDLARSARKARRTSWRASHAAEAGATHGEICTVLRRELGFGQPLAIV